MEELLLQAHVSAEKTFFVTCPNCKNQRLFRLSDFPPDSPNPLAYRCPCDAPLKIMLNYRKTHRKHVKLVGTFTLPSEPKKIERFCEILDISDQGMRITTNFFPTATHGQLLNARIILDDPRRSKLDLPSVVRSIRHDNRLLRIGVQFENLGAAQKEALGFYMMRLKGDVDLSQ